MNIFKKLSDKESKDKVKIMAFAILYVAVIIAFLITVDNHSEKSSGAMSANSCEFEGNCARSFWHF